MEDAKQEMQMCSIEAVVIRADGTREDLGVVSYWNADPEKQAEWEREQELRKTDGNGSH